VTQLQAGAAVVDITPPTGGLMDGYGDRRQPSQGVHDPLFARALLLDGGSPDERCAIISCDLLGMHPWITKEIRTAVSTRADIPPDHVLVCATHSHAGPYGLRGGMFARLDDVLASNLVRKLAGAVLFAQGQRRPATLKLGRSHLDTVSMNRRHPDWPIDPAMLLLLVDGDDGRPIASLLNFACHATVLSGANLLLSGEFPGAAARILLEQTGAPCIYLNGACGNVNPVWIRQDFDSVDRVGQIIAGQALRLIGELRTLGPGQRVHNIRWDEFLEKPIPGRIVGPRFSALRREIDLPLRDFAGDDDYASRISDLDTKAQKFPEASAQRREAMAQLTRTQSERWAAVWARQQDGAKVQRTEIQALSLGDGLSVIALPGEFFVETADTLRAAAPDMNLIVACYANDYIGYVIPPEAYDQGGYESGVTFSPPKAEAMVRDAAAELLSAVTG
jgi:hypothetical protein